MEPQEWPIKTQPPRPARPVHVGPRVPNAKLYGRKNGTLFHIFEFFTCATGEFGFFLLEPVICGKSTKLNAS